METSSKNPFGEFRKECEDALMGAWTSSLNEDVIFRRMIGKKKPTFSLNVPSSLIFGDLSSSFCFGLSKQLKKAPKTLAEKIVNHIDLSAKPLIRSVNVAGDGYINFFADYEKLSKLAIESAIKFGSSYGFVNTNTSKRFIVEHTSVNPAGPIHVGTARNSVLGDCLSRLLKARGHNVSTHFYIDDVGRQIAVLAYGYKMIGQSKSKLKIDHWIGLIYAITSCIIEIQRLKKQLKELMDKKAPASEVNETRRKLDDWVAAAADLYDRDKVLFNRLLDEITKDQFHGKSIAKIMYLYEREDVETKRLVREVVELCLNGFRETYIKAGIYWDSWDWESDLVWNGSVSGVVDKLRNSPHFSNLDGALVLKVEDAAREMNLKTLFEVSRRQEISPLILIRSDGTSLYQTRDIAYSLWKLKKADKVINVIGVEQALSQLQLRVALSILLSPNRAMDLIHYTYEHVDLQDYKMSKRRGRYIAFDDIIDEAVKRARREVEKRSSHLSAELKMKIANAVGVGAVKYALIEVDPKKRVVFTWDRVLNFEMNSAPFIQYAYARACNILKKAKCESKKPDFSLLDENIEKRIVRKIAVFPEIFIDAADNLEPNVITEYANDLSSKFNSFYASFPVLKAQKLGLRDARLVMVEAVKIVLRNSLELIGIEALERM